jgi:predicted RecB family nuclease
MLADRHPTSRDGQSNRRRVDWLLPKLLDLYRLLQRGFFLPFESYSIKHVAPGLGELPSPGGTGRGHDWLKLADVEAVARQLSERDQWPAADVARAVDTLVRTAEDCRIDVSQLLDASASMSVFWYELYCKSGEPIWRKLINLYNADDLVATQRLYDYLLRLHRSELAGIDIPNNPELTGTSQ